VQHALVHTLDAVQACMKAFLFGRHHACSWLLEDAIKLS
jgi:hypothetical protein